MKLEDINAFWKETLDELATVPMEAEVEESDPGGVMYEAVKTFQNHAVRFKSFEGKTIRAWYTVPIGAPPGGRLARPRHRARLLRNPVPLHALRAPRLRGARGLSAGAGREHCGVAA